MKHILKVGLAVVRDRRLLVVRKKGGRTFILPGGKPEPNEIEIMTLFREIGEELSTRPVDFTYEGDFSAAAADLPGRTVTVRLYVGELEDEPRIADEIEEMAWIDVDGDAHVPIADSIAGQIVPHLRRMLERDRIATEARGRAVLAANLIGTSIPAPYLEARRAALAILANHQEAVGRTDMAETMRRLGEDSAGIEACVSAMLDYAMLARDGTVPEPPADWPSSSRG